MRRLAELAADFGAEQIASAARLTADRVSAGLFYVACVGQFKRGKSTLLNALMGDAVLPTGVLPVTTAPTIIRYGDTFSGHVRLDADWIDIPLSALPDYVSEEKNPQNLKRVTRVEIFAPNALLKAGMCLVDTPGLGSVFEGNTATTHAFVPHIDGAIVVIGADPPLSGEELHLVQIVDQQVDNLLFVLNKADRVSEAERSAAATFAKNVLERHLKREIETIFVVSALDVLERRGPGRDWSLLVRALEDLVNHSGRALVRAAAERGIRRTSHQLRSVVKAERQALLRPVEESERRISSLRAVLEQAERAREDLGVLLLAEQQRLSATLSGRRSAFLGQVTPEASKELRERVRATVRLRTGPAYRREVNWLAQEIAREQVLPWLQMEASYAEEEFQNTADRFVKLANDFLRRLADSGIPGLPVEICPDREFGANSHFHFHEIERVAAPASPLLWLSDLLAGVIRLRQRFVRDGEEFLDQLLLVNTSRVQSDVENRVRESRKTLEAEIKEVLAQSSSIAARALEHAQTARSAGTAAVQAALARLDRIEQEISGFTN